MGNRDIVICPVSLYDSSKPLYKLTLNLISNLSLGPASQWDQLCPVAWDRQGTEQTEVQSQAAGCDAGRRKMHGTVSRCRADDPARRAFQSC